VGFLAVISAGLGLTSLAYRVLDATRITPGGVPLTLAVPVQLAGFPAHVEPRPGVPAHGRGRTRPPPQVLPPRPRPGAPVGAAAAVR
ncbi:hypothetical protein, partial [Staphylococcus haemolyticus]|uniref:hypothetical protein n=1 Tax=Staphylococcus haemolyticus TaxID=1283 RepID=UPI001C5C9A79